MSTAYVKRSIATTTASMVLPYLDTFSRTAELCNFTQAAKEIGLTQAAVSQRIQALEAVLGKSLFQRRGGHLQVTNAGRELYEYAQRILGLHEEARRVIAGRTIPVASELILAASSIPGEYLLPLVLSGFQRKHPNVHVRATVSDTATVLLQVERGEVNLGLVGRKANKPHFEFQFLAHDRLVLVMPAKHPLSKRRTVTVQDLFRYPVVLREVGSGLRHCLEASLERGGLSISDMSVKLELGSNEAIKDAVRRGIGVAVLSVYAVQRETKNGVLHTARIRDLNCDRDMFIVRDRRRVLPAPGRAFLTYLEAHPPLESTS